jgi:hypothetical protein
MQIAQNQADKTRIENLFQIIKWAKGPGETWIGYEEGERAVIPVLVDNPPSASNPVETHIVLASELPVAMIKGCATVTPENPTRGLSAYAAFENSINPAIIAWKKIFNMRHDDRSGIDVADPLFMLSLAALESTGGGETGSDPILQTGDAEAITAILLTIPAISHS